MNTNSKRLWICAGVLLAMLVGLNLAIHYTARTSQRRHMLAMLDRIPTGTDCIFLGNSLVEAGCDVEAFKAAWTKGGEPLKPVNLALGATSPVEHYLILKRALQGPIRIKYLVYGFFDDQLNAPARGEWSDLVGNRAFSYYFPSEAASLYAPGSWLKTWEMRIAGRIPMFAERSSLWGKVELLRRKFEDIGMPKHQMNRFGRVDDFSALESKDVDSFNERCGAVVGHQAGFSAAIRGILQLGREHGATVILVEMPMPSKHRSVFYASPAWKEMRAHLQSLAKQQQAVYLAASDWVLDDKKFEDATHLNEEGAKFFSGQLAAAIAELPREPNGTGMPLAKAKGERE